MNVVIELDEDELDGEDEVDNDSLGWLLFALIAVAEEVALDEIVTGDEFLLDKFWE